MPIGGGGGGGVIGRSSAAFLSALPVLLSVSILLLTYRVSLHLAATHVESVLDHDPNVQSLLGRLSSAGEIGAEPSRHREVYLQNQNRRRRRPPFLHLTRTGYLDDDFSDIDGGVWQRDDGFFNSSLLLYPHLNPGKRLWFAGDIRIRIMDQAEAPVLAAIPDEAELPPAVEEIKINILGQDFHLERRDAVALAYLTMLFSAVYLLATIGFLSLYSCAAGIVFLVVAEFLLGRRQGSLGRTIYAGSRLGTRRVLVFVFLRWVIRDMLAQFLCIVLFSDVHDQKSVLKLFVRVKLVPFLLTASPLTEVSSGDERSLWWFLLAWEMLERMVAVIFVFSWWAAVADHGRRRRGPEVLWEGFRQVIVMGDRALLLRQVEMMVCWNSGRWVLGLMGGRMFAAVVQAVAEVFFMVVWLVCYLDMRSQEERLRGRTFGWRDLEDSIRGFG